jgi:hypothetical protein
MNSKTSKESTAKNLRIKMVNIIIKTMATKRVKPGKKTFSIVFVFACALLSDGLNLLLSLV